MNAASSRIAHRPSRTVFALLSLAISLSSIVSAEEKPLADFETADAVKLNAGQAAARIVRQGNGSRLEIKTEGAGGYPGIQFEPPGGKWDLAKYDGVEIDVVNPDDTPLRVLLTLNNPGADGRNKCNTESKEIPPRETGTVTVPFGMWHGELNHPIDQANIVSIRVFLDNPKKPRTFFVDNLRPLKFDASRLEKLASDPFFQALKPPFGRGINLGNALEAPREGDWGVKLEERYFQVIAEAGFDSIRLPVKWSAHAEATAPYRIDPTFLARVDWALDQAQSRKLQVIMNIHHYGEMDERPDEHRARYLALWEQLSKHYAGRPESVAFELLNEPHGAMTAEKWNEIAAEAIKIVRRTNPTRRLVVGPVNWNAIAALPSLKLPEEEKNLIVTVHYYLPMKFTHQGAHWLGKESQAWLGTKWEGTKAERQAVTRDFDDAVAWSVKHRRPIYLGEFGAFEKADMESRAAWTRFIASEAARRKFGTAYWEFCSGFGVYDSKAGRWAEPLKQALLEATPVNDKTGSSR